MWGTKLVADSFTQSFQYSDLPVEKNLITNRKHKRKVKAVGKAITEESQ